MDNLALFPWALIFFGACVFVLGAIVGSWLNVCIARLPLEKSMAWPSSRCGRCLTPIRAYHNLPLISYWMLGGRCKSCGQAFSIRYFAVELLTALAFVGIFYLEIVRNVNDVPALRGARDLLSFAAPRGHELTMLIGYFAHRAILVSLLIGAAMCDHENRLIPLSITVPGTIIGIILATCFPWPWPNSPEQAMPLPKSGVSDWWLLTGPDLQKLGLYPWPVWGPPPRWMPAGSWRLGLATGIAGALAGGFLLRGVKFLCEKALGKEALGMGDADLMMMAGAFVGWQPVVIAFFAGAVVSLFLAVPRLLRGGEHSLPFGPGLAIGTVLVAVGWSAIAPNVQALFFYPTFLGLIVGLGAAVLFLLSFIIGRIQR
jgi:leader peptidase (prepilin peptidase)/N-methyltransferase